MSSSRDNDSENLIEMKFRTLRRVYTDSIRELRRGFAQNDGFAAKQNYLNTNTEKYTKELLDEYRDYMDSLDNVEDRQQVAGHFLFECKKYFHDLGWQAARDFTNYIAMNSPLKNEDKIHYLQYLLELIDPQKEENKEKKRVDLHPFEPKALKKLAEFQLDPKERENIDDIFKRVNIYLDKHKKYAPHIYEMSHSFVDNLREVKTEDVIKFSEVYFKAMKQMVKNNEKSNQGTNVIALNKLMFKEGNSKEVIDGVVKTFARYFKSTGATKLNIILCKNMGDMIQSKTRNYSEEEQKELQQVWLDNCPFSKKKNDFNLVALSFLNQIGPKISMSNKSSKDLPREEPIFEESYEYETNNETIEDKLGFIEYVERPSASDYIDTNEYADAEQLVNLAVREKTDSIFYDIQLSDNPKEKVLEIADAYKKLVFKSSFEKKSALDTEMVYLFNSVIERYDYTAEDVKDLLQHINQKQNERLEYTKVSVRKKYLDNKPEHKDVLSDKSISKVKPKPKPKPKTPPPSNQLKMKF